MGSFSIPLGSVHGAFFLLLPFESPKSLETRPFRAAPSCVHSPVRWKHHQRPCCGCLVCLKPGGGGGEPLTESVATLILLQRVSSCLVDFMGSQSCLNLYVAVAEGLLLCPWEGYVALHVIYFKMYFIYFEHCSCLFEYFDVFLFILV